MTIAAIRRVKTEIIEDQTVTGEEAEKLIKASFDGQVTAREKAEIQKIFESTPGVVFEPEAKEKIIAYLSGATLPTQPPTPPDEIIRRVAGRNPALFSDDTIYLGKDGTVKGDIGMTVWTRGYAPSAQGILRERNGSDVPPSAIHTPAQTQALQKKSPGTALDTMARLFGASTGFERMSHEAPFYRRDAQSWEGFCHGWTWAAQSPEINRAVDVNGDEGKRGVWLGGEFISRADLGNWMMGVANTVMLRDTYQLFQMHPSALDVLKGAMEYMMNKGGGGVGADVFNDEASGRREVWNQPFTGADITSKSITGATAAKIIDIAEGEGIRGSNKVKLVEVVGTYGTEAGDSHEETGTTSTKSWNMYVVTDANGRALTAYMANDDKLKNIAGIESSTDDLPDYLSKPTLAAIKDTLAGKSNRVVDSDAHGDEFRFFVGTVLTKAVPAAVRELFEKDLKALPAGAIDAPKAAALAKKYKNIANAYAPEEWRKNFASRGLAATAFGASF